MAPKRTADPDGIAGIGDTAQPAGPEHSGGIDADLHRRRQPVPSGE